MYMCEAHVSTCIATKNWELSVLDRPHRPIYTSKLETLIYLTDFSIQNVIGHSSFSGI